MPKATTAEHKHKHLVLDQNKLEQAKKVLGARTETETIDRALERVISEDEKNRRAWAAHERFIRAAIRQGVEIDDAFKRLER